jgi:hypothetical protein
LNRVFSGTNIAPPPILESDSATSRGRMLLLNVGGPDLSNACADR